MYKNKLLIGFFLIVFILTAVFIGLYSIIFSLNNVMNTSSQNTTEKKLSDVKNQKELAINKLKTTNKEVELSYRYNLRENSISFYLTSESKIADGEILITYPKLVKYLRNAESNYFATVRVVESTNENNNVLRIGLLGNTSKVVPTERPMPNFLITKIYFSSLTENAVSIMQDETQFFDFSGAQMSLKVL